MDEALELTVIGTGNIGATLARRWTACGHRLTFGARDPEAGHVRALVAELGHHTRVRAMGDAVAGAAAVLVATPGAAVPELAASLGPAPAGTVVLDATNHMGSERASWSA